MRVKIGDVRLFFDVEGAKLRPDGAKMREAPTIVLLHGGPGFDHSNFKPDFSPMAEIAQVVYLDHRGNGRSDRGDRSKWNLAQWGDDVRSFCEALEIERPIVMGVSFGGMVAMSYATRHPEHPGKLVLSSTAAVSRQDRSLEMFERLGGAEVREAAAIFRESGGGNDGRLSEKVYAPVQPDSVGARVRAALGDEPRVDGRFFQAGIAHLQLPARPWADKMPDADRSGRTRSHPAGCRLEGHRRGNGAGRGEARSV
ncbi:alpha/beta fold hydrolase [Candidatus Binatus sp.]|uniref:alpha/beta fold hydrolase n=1 Tax=Candidatus Binatus sp. TaxID=2811406 RepID=UPI003C773ED8